MQVMQGDPAAGVVVAEVIVLHRVGLIGHMLDGKGYITIMTHAGMCILAADMWVYVCVIVHSFMQV